MASGHSHPRTRTRFGEPARAGFQTRRPIQTDVPKTGPTCAPGCAFTKRARFPWVVGASTVLRCRPADATLWDVPLDGTADGNSHVASACDSHPSKPKNAAFRAVPNRRPHPDAAVVPNRSPHSNLPRSAAEPAARHTVVMGRCRVRLRLTVRISTATPLRIRADADTTTHQSSGHPPALGRSTNQKLPPTCIVGRVWAETDTAARRPWMPPHTSVAAQATEASGARADHEHLSTRDHSKMLRESKAQQLRRFAEDTHPTLATRAIRSTGDRYTHEGLSALHRPITGWYRETRN